MMMARRPLPPPQRSRAIRPWGTPASSSHRPDLISFLILFKKQSNVKEEKKRERERESECVIIKIKRSLIPCASRNEIGARP